VRLDVPILTYEKIASEANRTLLKLAGTTSPPVPIEEIVDLKLGMDIVPIPGLKQGFALRQSLPVHSRT